MPISERLKGQLDGLVGNVVKDRQESRAEGIREVTDQLKPILESRDAEIARLQTELESKSGLSEGESAEDFADRIGGECVDYLNAALGYM